MINIINDEEDNLSNYAALPRNEELDLSPQQRQDAHQALLKTYPHLDASPDSGAAADALASLRDVRTVPPVNNSIPSQQGILSSIPNQPASVSEFIADQTNPNELILNDVEQAIVTFEPNRFILGTLANVAAHQRPSSSMEVEYFALGSDRISSALASNYSPITPVSTSPLPIPQQDALLFLEDSLVKVRGVSGYLPDGATPDSLHELLLQVVARDEASRQPIFYAVNGPKFDPDDVATLIPPIPVNTPLFLLNTAAAESQLFTQPSAHVPRPKVAFMQRKILNIQVSKYFSAVPKKVRWGRQDILETAIREFRRKSEFNYLEGVQSKRMTVNSARKFAGQEFIYTSEGILSQLRKSFRYDPNDFSFLDLVKLSELLFADNNASKRALLCVGKRLASSILSIQYTLTKDLSISASSHWGINMTDFSSLFGTLSMVHYPFLDELGRSDQGFAIDVSRLSRFVFRRAYEQSVDMRVHGEDASRDIYIETDCLVLKGDNHALISPFPPSSTPSDPPAYSPLDSPHNSLPHSPYTVPNNFPFHLDSPPNSLPDPAPLNSLPDAPPDASLPLSSDPARQFSPSVSSPSSQNTLSSSPVPVS
ncbi:MAG: hypothetical protein LBU03_02375 [Tannerellaceae bacterium]|nr:hypothetical protein [Tannerellaceae bacterium]